MWPAPEFIHGRHASQLESIVFVVFAIGVGLFPGVFAG